MKPFKKTKLQLPPPIKWQTLRFDAWLDDEPDAVTTFGGLVMVKLQVNFEVAGKIRIRLRSDSDYHLQLDEECFKIKRSF